MIRKFFSPPVFHDDEEDFRARFINGFAWFVIGLLIAAIFLSDGLDLRTSTTDFVLIGLIVVQGIALYLLRKEKIVASGLIIVALGWIGLTYQAYNVAGVKDAVIIAYIAAALLASILIGQLAGGLVIVASIGAIWVLALLDVNNVISPEVSKPLDFARDLSLVFLVITALIYFSTARLRDAINRANKSEAGLRSSNEELQELNQSLEDRVNNRTAELELANQRNEKRAKQFEAIAQVAHATTTNEKLETLLPRLTSLISEQFGFYHAGIFLLDENREYAVLRAANSEGGKRMLEHGHKLPVGQTGIVGFVSATGSPRIALDVGADAVFFNNPDLPDTRSELALPLRIAGEIIGVLDVQSIVSNVFQEEDTDVLSTLADQVAVAIQNARSFETTQELLKEAQKYSREFLRESWRVLRAEQDQVGYMISKNNLKPLSKPITSAQIRKATADKKTVIENGKTATLAVPIRLRNDVIGVMDIRVPDEHNWDDDEVDIVEAVAERLSLALETSMLLQTTRRRAEIERITADISGRISSTTQFDSILRTAAEELSRVLGGSDVLVQIQPEALETHVETEQAQVKE
jgi:GAF domain-containing protein